MAAGLPAVSPVLGLETGLAVLGVGIVAVAPASVGLLLGVSFWNTDRVALGNVVSNVAVAVLAVVSLVVVVRRIDGLGRVLAGPLAYIALMAPGTLLQPSAKGLRSLLLQRPVIGAGALLAGVLLHRLGAVRMLLLGLYLGSVVFGLGVVYSASVGQVGFAGVNKNYIGPLLAAVALLRIVPHDLPAPTALKGPHLAVVGVGLLAAQSRSAVLGLVVGLLYFAVKSGRLSSALPRLGVVAAAAALTIVIVLVTRAQLNSGDRFNSAAVRPVDALSQIQFFLDKPLLGFGMENIFVLQTESAYGAVTAPSVVLQALAEGGILGGLGIVSLIVLVFRGRYGGATLVVRALLLARVTEGQFDFFWLAGATSLTFLLAGAALGRHASSRSVEESGRHQSEPVLTGV